MSERRDTAPTGSRRDRRTRSLRIAVAFLFHAPGLWLIGTPGLGRGVRRKNVVAVLATLLAMGVAGAVTRSAWPAIIAWAVGHVAWGTWLAARLARGVGDDG